MGNRASRPDEVTKLQVMYIKVTRRTTNTYRGAKREVYDNNIWTFSKSQANRLMAKVDTWSEEQKDLLLAIYYDGNNI